MINNDASKKTLNMNSNEQNYESYALILIDLAAMEASDINNLQVQISALARVSGGGNNGSNGNNFTIDPDTIISRFKDIQ